MQIGLKYISYFRLIYSKSVVTHNILIARAIIFKGTKTMSANAAIANDEPILKDLYPMGEIPPAFHVPEKMWAWAIRRDCLLYTSRCV